MTSKTRTANMALAALIEEANWTKVQMASAVNELGRQLGLRLRYDKSAVCHWVDGTGPARRIRPLVCEVLSRRLGRHITLEAAGLVRGQGPDTAAAGHDWDADIVTDLNTLGGADMDPTRRSVLGTGLYSAALAIPGWADVKGRFAHLVSEPNTRIGQAEVDAIRDMTDRLSSLDDRFGGRAVRPMAAAFLVNTIVPGLKASASEPVKRELLIAAADHCYLTGYMAMDEREDHLAQRYYLKALQLAAAAEDHLTYATTLRGMSVMAVDLGHNGYALHLAEAASAASPEAGPRMKAFLAGQLAHAAAACGTGHRSTALARIRDAETAMEQAESQSKALGSYDPASLNYHIAQVRYSLGDKKDSLSAMARADRIRDSSYERVRIRHLGMLAERRLEIGHLEAACADWHRMLDGYPTVQSGRCDDRFNAMVRALKPHTRNRHAREVLHRAEHITGDHL